MKGYRTLNEGQAVAQVKVKFRNISVNVFEADISFLHCHDTDMFPPLSQCSKSMGCLLQGQTTAMN